VYVDTNVYLLLMNVFMTRVTIWKLVSVLIRWTSLLEGIEASMQECIATALEARLNSGGDSPNNEVLLG
jgi:hypothetical protein